MTAPPAWPEPRRYRNLKSSQVNWAYLARELYATCLQRRTTLQNAATEMGVHPSELSRLRQGRPLNADTLASLVVWLRPDDIPDWITGPSAPGGRP